MNIVAKMLPLLIYFIGTMYSHNLVAATKIDPEIKIRAAYIYKFTKFISWPEDAFTTSDSNFTICIANNRENGITAILKNGLFGRFHKKHPLKIIKITNEDTSDNTLEQCHILYITESAPATLIQQNTRKQPNLLTINANQNIQVNSIISFFDFNNRIIFSINSTQLNKSNINISATLLTLARNIKGANFD